MHLCILYIVFFSYSFGKLIRLKERREKLTLGMQLHRLVNKWETAEMDIL